MFTYISICLPTFNNKKTTIQKNILRMKIDNRDVAIDTKLNLFMTEKVVLKIVLTIFEY